MTPYTIAPQAQTDLDEVWDYVADDSVTAADQLLATFHDKFLLLSSHPLIGQTRYELRPNLRCFSVGSYVVYYQPEEERIRIVRVLHGARDVDALF